MSVVERLYLRDVVVFNGSASLISSNSMFKLFDCRVLVALLLDAVLELSDERLVPDENDEPSEMIEFGRCVLVVFSATIVPENELRNFGAKSEISMEKLI